MTVERCGDCRWYHVKEKECRAHPPKAFVFPGSKSSLTGQQTGPAIVGIWPSTREGEWCGEFKAKPGVDA